MSNRPSDAGGVDVSYVVAAHDAAPFIESALASALEGQGAEVEAIVVDDASRDGTADRVADMAAREPRLRLIRLDDNAGPSGARNRAIAEARGRWVAVLDADDILFPGRTARLLDLAAATGADIVADDLERFDDRTGRSLSRLLRPSPQPYAFRVAAAPYVAGNRLNARGSGLGYLKPMFRRSFLIDRGLAYDPRLRVGEDFAFGLEALLGGARYIVSSEAGYRYRVREGSLSHRLKGSDIAGLQAWWADIVAREDAGAPALRTAMEAYGRDLERAALFDEFIALLKAGRAVPAAGVAAGDMGLWPLIARRGSEALLKRLPRPFPPKRLRDTPSA